MGLLQPHGRYGRGAVEADLKRTVFTPFAKAQAFGLALGGALALYAAHRAGLGLGLFAVATLAAWIGWEFLLGKRAPSARSDWRALAYGVLSGFAFPWIGFLFAALAEWMRP